MNPDKLRSEIASSFQIVKERSTEDEICIICPVPGCADTNGNRHINVKTLYTHCWRCGDKQPNHVKSLFHILGLEFTDDHILEPSELLELLQPKPKKALTPIQDVALPGGFEMLVNNRSSCYWKFCKRMAERKRLTIEDLEAAQAGFTREGDWEPFCIFPVIESPRMVYYQGRRYSDAEGEKTKKFPSKREVPYGPNYWVYNLDSLSQKTTEVVVIVESILNVLSLKKRLSELEISHIVPVCIFTHRLSRSQVAKIKRYAHVKEWCLLFDSDSTSLAEETAINLSAVIPTSIAQMPHGKNEDGSDRFTNDANDDVDAALIAINDRKLSDPDKVKSKKPEYEKKPSRWF